MSVADTAVNPKESEHSMQKLFKTLEYLRDKTGNPDLLVVAVQMLLEVSLRDETPMGDLESAVGVSQATVSRNVAKLGVGMTFKEKGAGLVEAYEDPKYRRQKLVRLTPKSRRLVDELYILMNA